MEVVINKCYGGFSLSPAAVKRIAELTNRECYFYTLEYDDNHKSSYKLTDNPSGLFISAFDIPDIDNAMEIISEGKDWHEMSDEQKTAYNNAWSSHDISNRDYERNDPLLIQVVKELGDEASGSYAKLAIIEIPDDVEWEIDEYDGFETIREESRSWG